MNEEEIKNKVLKAVEEEGIILTQIIDELSIPLDLKVILLANLPNLSEKPKELHQLTKELLEEYFKQKIVEADSEYQKAIKKINRDTSEKMKKILTK